MCFCVSIFLIGNQIWLISTDFITNCKKIPNFGSLAWLWCPQSQTNQTKLKNEKNLEVGHKFWRFQKDLTKAGLSLTSSDPANTQGRRIQRGPWGSSPQCGNFRIFLSLRFYVKSTFGESRSCKTAFFYHFRDTEFCWFGKFQPSISSKNQNSSPLNVLK